MSDPSSSTQPVGSSSRGASTPGSSSSSSSASSSSASSGSQMAKLQTEHGTTTIADSVVAKIAALAAKEVEGVADLGGGVGSAMGSVVGRIRGSEHQTSGVGVEVGATQAAVDVTMKVLYPASLHQVAEAVRSNVIDRIESMTGLEVTEVNVTVTDLSFPGGQDEDQDQGSSQPEPAPSRVQ